VLVSFASAPAGQNPDAFAYVDFDPPYGVQRVDPEPYEYVTAYFMLGCVPGGFRNVSVALYVTPETSANTVYENVLPAPLSIGDFEEGVTIGSSLCVGDGPVAFAAAHIIYTGTPGDVMILDHPQWPRWVVDCTEPIPLVDYYCLLSNGGIGKDPIPTGETCGCPTPVEDESWGSIKALYR
jgi:hypothetical protein